MYLQHNFSRNERSISLLITATLAELSLLVIQFIIGMWMNLFAVFSSSGAVFTMYGMMGIMFSVPELMVHVMIGVLIGLLSVMIFALTMMRSDRKSAVVSAIASLSIFFAGIYGLEFIFTGFQNNIFSFIMSLGFIIAVISYVFLIYSLSVSSGSVRLHQ